MIDSTSEDVEGISVFGYQTTEQVVVVQCPSVAGDQGTLRLCSHLACSISYDTQTTVPSIYNLNNNIMKIYDT